MSEPEKDLFGAEILESEISAVTGKPKRKTVPNGYAARPGPALISTVGTWAAPTSSAP